MKFKMRINSFATDMIDIFEEDENGRGAILWGVVHEDFLYDDVILRESIKKGPIEVEISLKNT